MHSTSIPACLPIHASQSGSSVVARILSSCSREKQETVVSGHPSGE